MEDKMNDGDQQIATLREEVCRLCSSASSSSVIVWTGDRNSSVNSPSESRSSHILRTVQEFLHIQIAPIDQQVIIICGHCIRFVNKLKSFSEHCRKVQTMFQMAMANQDHQSTSEKVLFTDWDEIRTICEIDNFTWKVVDASSSSAVVDDNDDPMPDFTITPSRTTDEEIHFFNDLGEEITFAPEFIVLDETHQTTTTTTVNVVDPEYVVVIEEPETPKELIEDQKSTKKPKKQKLPYECPECGKILASRASFQTHKQSHGGGKSFSCRLCEKQFVRSDVLRNHMLTHTGQRKFGCSACDKTFYRAADLRSHQRIHDDSKPFSCTDCDKQFKRAGDLRSHNLTTHDHARKQEFQCAICDKRLVSLGGLKYHLQVHAGEKPHECPKCELRFRQAGNLKKHVNKVHS